MVPLNASMKSALKTARAVLQLYFTSMNDGLLGGLALPSVLNLLTLSNTFSIDRYLCKMFILDLVFLILISASGLLQTTKFVLGSEFQLRFGCGVFRLFMHVFPNSNS